MARRRQLTKAECGRLGGKATAAKYGREHMAAIGARGFDGLAKSLGYMGGGRLGALQRLIGTGRIRPTAAARRSEAEAVAWADAFLDVHCG